MDEFYDNLNLKQEFIPAGRENRSGRAIVPTLITVHNTSNASPGANAAAHSRFVRNTGHYMLNGKKNWVSWHFTVDDVQAIQHLPIKERGIHAGPGNESIGIEVCMHQGIDQAAADLRAARLVAKLLEDLDLGNDAVRTHQSWTGKHCPAVLLGNWQGFLQKVASARAEIPHGFARSDIFVAPAGDAALKNLPDVSDEELNGDLDHESVNAALIPSAD